MKRSNKVRAVVLCVVYAMLLPEVCNVNYVICDCSVCCSLAVQLQLHSWSAPRELGKSGWMCNWKVVCKIWFLFGWIQVASVLLGVIRCQFHLSLDISCQDCLIFIVYFFTNSHSNIYWKTVVKLFSETFLNFLLKVKYITQEAISDNRVARSLNIMSNWISLITMEKW